VAVDDIFDAVREGDLGRVRDLVEKDPGLAGSRDGEGLSVILHARYRDREDMIEVLLSAGPELDVLEASAIGDTDRVEQILAADPRSVHVWSVDGYSPLPLAAFFGHARTAQLLLDRGADVSAVSRNRMEVMPLHSAVAGRHRAVAEALLSAGAPVDARTHGGFTPLLEAAQNGDRPLVELLLSKGADPSVAADNGKTARDLALDAGHEDVADLLEDRG